MTEFTPEQIEALQNWGRKQEPEETDPPTVESLLKRIRALEAEVKRLRDRPERPTYIPQPYPVYPPPQLYPWEVCPPRYRRPGETWC